jgi:glycoside/pentoside/hexuronide:cation symporter, GPH family
MANDIHKLTVGEKVGYGLGDMASNLFWQMFAIYIAMYYTDVFGLTAAAMGTMMGVTRIGDAFIDPMIGVVADRTKSRWGHFRPYLVWMALPMAITAVLAFTTPGFGPTGKLIYAYVTLSLMMVAYSAINIPYSALLGVLSPDSAERTSASSYRFVLALVPVFIIVYTAVPMAQYFGGSKTSTAGWQMAMVVYSIAAIVLFLITFATTKERVQPPPKQKSSLKQDLRSLFGNKPWLVLCAVGIAALTYANIRGMVVAYYFKYVVPNGDNYFGPVMSTGAVAFILGVMATGPLSKRFGKRNFYMVSMLVTTALTVAFYFVPKTSIGLIWAMHGLISLCAAPTAPLVWAMLADAADYQEWKSNRRATGLVFSAASFAQKFGWAIGGVGTGWLLGLFGFEANVQQTPRAENGIMMMMSVIPAVASLIAAGALFFYKLDEPMVKRMSEDLAERRAQEPPADVAVA